jgi:CelD/BcsL family acetyltransferase involved in cellulose biosynthesis
MATGQNEVVVMDGVAALERWAPALDELCAAVGAPITARAEWLTCWARQHVDWLPLGVMVWRSDVLVAAALLARRQVRGVSRVAMLGQGQSDYACLPCRDEAAAACLADGIVAALRGLHRPWTVHLAQLPAGDPVLALLAGRLRCSVVEPGDPSPFVRFAPGEDLRPLVRRNAKKITARARNRLVRENVHPAVQRTSDVEGVTALLPALAGVRAARDTHLGRRSDHLDPATREFWFEVLTQLARSGSLEVTTLRLDGRLAAYAVALLDSSAYRVWDTRIQPELREYAPGHLLRDALLEQLHVDGRFSEYDTMRGTEPYKNAVASELREAAELRAWSSPLLRMPRQLRRQAAVLRDRHTFLVKLDAMLRGHQTVGGART